MESSDHGFFAEPQPSNADMMRAFSSEILVAEDSDSLGFKPSYHPDPIFITYDTAAKPSALRLDPVIKMEEEI